MARLEGDLLAAQRGILLLHERIVVLSHQKESLLAERIAGSGAACASNLSAGDQQPGGVAAGGPTTASIGGPASPDSLSGGGAATAGVAAVSGASRGGGAATSLSTAGVSPSSGSASPSGELFMSARASSSAEGPSGVGSLGVASGGAAAPSCGVGPGTSGSFVGEKLGTLHEEDSRVLHMLGGPASMAAPTPRGEASIAASVKDYPAAVALAALQARGLFSGAVSAADLAGKTGAGADVLPAKSAAVGGGGRSSSAAASATPAATSAAAAPAAPMSLETMRRSVMASNVDLGAHLSKLSAASVVSRGGADAVAAALALDPGAGGASRGGGDRQRGAPSAAVAGFEDVAGTIRVS